MNHPDIIAVVCSLLLVAALVAAGCTFTSGGNVTPAPVPTPVATPGIPETLDVSTCGFTTCHGADLACGTNSPDVCTTEYRIGDRCRKYARCDTGGGSCTLVISSKFTACKACAERCQIQAGPDSLTAFSCEEKC